MSRFVIYKIYWPSRAFYIGKTKGLRKRRNRHLREMKDGTHHNRHLIRLHSKFGEPKIKVIAYADSEEHMHVLERQFLDYYKNNERCKNIQAW